MVIHERTTLAAWLAAPPRAWPPPPDRMSVSALQEIEACPRRWALELGVYPEVWERPGYPRPATEAALEGQVVHRALERITASLARAGCTAVDSPTFVEVMRALGGFRQVLQLCVAEIIVRQQGNPRFERRLEALTRWLDGALPELRARVQQLVHGLRLAPRSSAIPTGAPVGLVPAAHPTPKHRRPLPKGTHAEVELKPDGLDWCGVADLVSLSDDGCEIVDFKTGRRKTEHAFQVQTYGLLWSLDRTVNPAGSPATRLTIAYPDGDESVALPDGGFERSLRARTEASLAIIQQNPPPARPSVEHCRICGVRQLCDEYWRLNTQRLLATQEASERQGDGGARWPVDLEVDVSSQRDAHSWYGAVRSSGVIEPGSDVIIKLIAPDAAVQEVMATRGRVRVIGAHLTGAIGEEHAHQPVLITLSGRTEVFLVS